MTVNIKCLIILSLTFVLFTVIGTISHEYGHIAVAKYYGYETTLHYGSMNYYPKGYLDDPDLKALKSLNKDYVNTEYDSIPPEISEKTQTFNNQLQKRYWNEENNDSLLISIGGPLQTMLTGLIGLIFLILRRKSIKIEGMKRIDWLAVFLGLFWLRAIFNLITSFGSEIISPNGKWFGGDEYFISIGLNLWPGTFSIILAALGLFGSVYIVFNIVPKSIRLTFILSGLIGGISGFTLWMILIGPKVLP